MKTKHTAGPWKHEGDGYITGIENDPANKCVGLVDIASVYLRTVPGRHDANARLIAAAPDLLDVVKGFRRKLETYVSVYPGDKELRRLLSNCDAAIAKVTGDTA